MPCHTLPRNVRYYFEHPDGLAGKCKTAVTPEVVAYYVDRKVELDSGLKTK